MTETDQTTVGKKGEILPKSRLRKAAGIEPGDKITILASFGEIVIRKILSIDEALSLPKIATYSPEKAERVINEESKAIEDFVN